MDIRTGEVVSVRHYSGKKLFRSIVVKKELDDVTIKLLEKPDLKNFLKGDPAVLGFESQEEVYIASCNISNIDYEQDFIVLKVDSLEVLANKRLSERLPVSFNAEIKIGESQTKHLALIKNISFTGMLIYSKSEFPLYQKLKISLNSHLTITLPAVIVRKSKENDTFEYGLKIVYTDVTTPELLKKYLLYLKKDQSDFIKKFCNEEVHIDDLVVEKAE